MKRAPSIGDQGGYGRVSLAPGTGGAPENRRFSSASQGMKDQVSGLPLPGPALHGSRSGRIRRIVGGKPRPRLTINDHLWTGTLGSLALPRQTTMLVLIAYFLLATGDSFRRKTVRLAGPRLSRKRITLEALVIGGASIR